LAAGFAGDARLIALAERALDDLMADAPAIESGLRCGFSLCVTDADTRRWLPPEPMSLEVIRQQQRDDAKNRQKLAANIVELAGLPVPAEACRVFATGPTGFVAAVDQAMAAFQADELDACIVGGVDSLVDPAVLRFLHQAGRLKTPDDPTGLIPGEAAAFLLLRPPRGGERDRPPLARVIACGEEQGEDPEVVERSPRGTALASLMSRLVGVGAGTPETFWFLTDQNGETFRAAEWGDFVSRGAAWLQPFAPEDHWCPAISFGDTGAASSALAACMAVRAYARRYAVSSTAFVIASAFEGIRAAIRLEGRHDFS
jgi:3-oxoacyl-[acyl-carrier-protein] synthase-1